MLLYVVPVVTKSDTHLVQVETVEILSKVAPEVRDIVRQYYTAQTDL